jgi:hypothetical protein
MWLINASVDIALRYYNSNDTLLLRARLHQTQVCWLVLRQRTLGSVGSTNKQTNT